MRACSSHRAISRLLLSASGRHLDNAKSTIRRQFSAASCRRTDGVFQELVAMRVQQPWIEALREKQQREKQSLQDVSPDPVQRNLSPKKMSDSYHRVVLPLARDPWLLDTYANASGHIRLGTLFMDLDALSGVIAYKHTGPGVTTVTAAFDRINLNHAITEICDLELSGQVTYASGRSSMEITLQVAKAPKEGAEVQPEDIMITCQCTMVSLDPVTKKPVNIAPVLQDTAEEKQLYARGEQNSKRRKAEAQRSLQKTAPDEEESALIHAIWQHRMKCSDPNDPAQRADNVVDMLATRISTTSIMQPQYRNRHNFMIFGGFLLKQTFELAFCCAASFAHTRPTFVSLDPSTFQNPVPVGSVLYLTATVVYTDPPVVSSHAEEAQGNDEAGDHQGQTRVQIRVDSKVRNVEHGETKPTGQFFYTFLVDKSIKLMPRTYVEFMMYLDGRRRAKNVLESMRQDGADPGSKKRVTE